MSNWTGIAGVHPRPFATAIKYYCRREGWGFPSTGLNETQIRCLWDGQWSNDVNIETCISKNQTDQTDPHPIISELPCKTPPPPSLPGEGAEMNYGPEVTTYRCPNGLEWSNGQWPYLENECLNKKWQYRTSLPACRSQLSHFIFYIFIGIFQSGAAARIDRRPLWVWTLTGPTGNKQSTILLLVVNLLAGGGLWGTASSTTAPAPR